MNITLEHVREAALQLSEPERLELADLLMGSVSPDSVFSSDDSVFLDELDRRCHDGTPSIPWSQVQSELSVD